MVNLFLVVIATQFSETKRRETEKIAEERKRYKSSTTLTSTKTESEGCYNQMLKYIIHLVRRHKRRLKRMYKTWQQKRAAERESDMNLADIKLNVFGNHIHCQPCEHLAALIDLHRHAPIASPEPSDIDSASFISHLPRHIATSPRLVKRMNKTSPLKVDPLVLLSPEAEQLLPTEHQAQISQPISGLQVRLYLPDFTLIILNFYVLYENKVPYIF